MKITKKGILSLFSILLAIVLLGCVSTPIIQDQSIDSESTVPLEVFRIGIEESKTAFDNGEAIFLDVRSEDSYAASHIPGALSIPLNDLEARIEELDPNQWIITYCT